MTTKSAASQPSSSSEDKKSTDEKHFAVISKESICMYGEGTSHTNLSDEITTLMGEDTSYRLRQVIQVSSQFMRHSRRKKLTTSDVNNGLQTMDVQAVYGYGSSDVLPFLKAKEGLYHPADKYISLSDVCTAQVTPKHCPHTTVTDVNVLSINVPIASWASLEGVTQTLRAETAEVDPVTQPLSDDLHTYYTNITQAVLSSDAELVKISLDDLRTNNKIAPLLPYLVSFVSSGVKSSSHDTNRMMKFLYIIKAVTSNKYLNLHPPPYLQLLVDTVLYCLLEPLAASINPLNDHWILRDYAANLLTSISGLNNLQTEIITKVHGTLQDLTKPFCCHYGAVVALIALGHQCMEEILIPELSLYWNHLDLTLNDPSCSNTPIMADALKVYCSLMLAVNLVLRQKIKRFNEHHALSKTEDINNPTNVPDGAMLDVESIEGLLDFYTEMHEYFGDGLSLQLPEVETKHVFKPSQNYSCMDLGDADTNKSGEELLAEFMNQVHDKKVKVKDEPNEAEVRLRQARLDFVSQKATFVRKREIKQERDDDDLYGGGVKKSRLQEEWLDEVKQSGGLQRRGKLVKVEEDQSRSSEGSDSLHSEDVSYPSVESEVSDQSEGIKITIKMSSSSPTVSHLSSPSKGKKKATESKSLPLFPLEVNAEHRYQFDTTDFTNVKHINTPFKDVECDAETHGPESPRRESLKLKLPVPGKVKTSTNTTKFN